MMTSVTTSSRTTTAMSQTTNTMLILVERPDIYTPAVLSDGSGSSGGFNDEHVKGTIEEKSS
jgi:hypothetical protein